MKRIIRYALMETLILIARCTQRFRSFGIPIFVYHSIDHSGTSIALSPDIFEQQLHYLRAHSFCLISTKQALSTSLQNHPTHKCVLLTFDDAYTTIAPYIENLLEQSETATVFVPSSAIGRSNLWDADRKDIAQIEIMSSIHLKALAQKGCEMGAHTHTHPNLTHISSTARNHELCLGRSELEQQIDSSIETLAYPYGAFNEDVKKATQEAGYKAAFTTQLGYFTQQSDLFAIPRFPTNIDFQLFRLIVHGGYGWYRKLQDFLFA
jgi:peptidoglycan/xylan/chitin deacetylase (PgdA/CDA1 family)